MRIPHERIGQLAPQAFESLRSSRYRAEEQAIELAALPGADRPLVRAIYDMLGELVALTGADDLPDASPVLAFCERRAIPDLLHKARRLGGEVPASAVHVAEALHDIRGGALTTLFVQLARVERIPWRGDLGRALFIAARDQMKMMRNVVADLDPVSRARDLSFLPHSLFDVARAMRDFTGTVAGQRVVVDVDCPADAVIAESCVECSAIDRVAYNLLNNAVRYADGPTIDAWLITLAHDLRVVIANSVSAEQRATVAEVVASGAAPLFGTFTTSGSGYGLRIVSELVGRAYGVASVDTLVGQGYLGASIVEESFVTWFHWPLSGA